MPDPGFVHLHVHTEYSLLDGAAKIDKLLDRALEYRMPAIATTDHGNMFGAIEFCNAARKRGIKPIVGSEMYVAKGSRHDRKTVDRTRDYHHLTLLVETERGYQNLMYLSSLSYREGFYYRPRIDKKILRGYSEGLIALSGCLEGEPSNLLLQGRKESALAAVREYQEIFGVENYFLELMDNGLEDQKRIIPDLIDIARQTGAGLVATNDVHYVDKDDAIAQEVLMCIQTNTTVKDPDRLRFTTQEFYLKPPKQMAALFDSVPEAIENTIKISERCVYQPGEAPPELPHFKVPDGYTDDSYLRELCEHGLKERYEDISPEIRDRLEMELRVISKMGYSSYFLIVSDFVRFARSQDIPVGPGRGSAAGSLVAYLLHITNLDPLEHGLLFERFLNPDRVSLPDIDIDFCYERRGEIINYVIDTYHKDNVAQIITFGTMAARAAIRDVGRGLGIPYGRVDEIAKLVPNELNITLDSAIKRVPELRGLMKSDPEVDQLLEIARSLEGISRHASTHAAGVVISPRPIYEFVPLYKGGTGDVTTQYSMTNLEQIGLLKMDFLGLKTLTVIHQTVEMIGRLRGEEIDIDDIPLDDPPTYLLLNNAHTLGVFQLESSGMRDLARKVGIDKFEDLVALVALFRPGPMHMLPDYIKRKHGEVDTVYEAPALESILKETHGVMLYQEQVMKIASELAGFSMSEADMLRKAMGKKNPEVMERYREVFIEGAAKNEIPTEVAQRIYEQMAQFAGYGFNKSHSAAYALIAFQTAYLKANYPIEYMAALLSSEMGNTAKLAMYIEECRRMNIAVLPPDVNMSELKFAVVGDEIRFGLAAVKNAGENAIKAIIEERQNGGPFKSLFDFGARVDGRVVNKRVFESLVKCGAFDTEGVRRSQIFAAIDLSLDQGQSVQRDKQMGQEQLFEPAEDEAVGPVRYPPAEDWPDFKQLAYEKEVLGLFITGHPLAKHSDRMRALSTATSTGLNERKDGDSVIVGGIVTKVKTHVPKRKRERMAFVAIEDMDGVFEAVVFSDLYARVSDLLEEDSLVMVTGRVNYRDGEPKVIAEDVVPLEEAEGRFARACHIRLATAGLEEGELEELARIVLENAGRCRLFIHCSTSEPAEVIIESAVGGGLNPTPRARAQIEELMGEGSIWFTARTDPAPAGV